MTVSHHIHRISICTSIFRFRMPVSSTLPPRTAAQDPFMASSSWLSSSSPSGSPQMLTYTMVARQPRRTTTRRATANQTGRGTRLRCLRFPTVLTPAQCRAYYTTLKNWRLPLTHVFLISLCFAPQRPKLDRLVSHFGSFAHVRSRPLVPLMRSSTPSSSQVQPHNDVRLCSAQLAFFISADLSKLDHMSLRGAICVQSLRM